jgi:hypothetical protein
MKKTRHCFLFVSGLLCSLSMLAMSVKPCTRAGPFTFGELFDNANVIVRATAIKYAKAPDDPNIRTTGEPDSIIQFKVEEALRGKDLPDDILLNGYLSDKDDYNETTVPYTFVRPNGRSGSCFANTYKQGAQFLLFLKKVNDKYTSNISALGPTNEQLRSESDPWLQWVKDHLRKEEKPKQQWAFASFRAARRHGSATSPVGSARDCARPDGWCECANRRASSVGEGMMKPLPRRYLSRLLKPLGIRVTQIAMGVPVGSDLE